MLDRQTKDMATLETPVVINETFGEPSLTGQRFRHWIRSRTAAFARSGMSYQDIAMPMIHTPRRAKLAQAVRSTAVHPFSRYWRNC